MMGLLQRLRRMLQAAFRPLSSSVVAVVVLGLGLGLTTTLFSVIWGLFLRPLPFEQPDRLVEIDRHKLSEGIERMPLDAEDYVRIRQAQGSFEQVAGWYGVAATLSGAPGAAERLNAAHVSVDLFSLLRVSPVRGRLFEAADERPGAEPVVLISYQLWCERFGRGEDVVGRTVRVYGAPTTIIGVMPEGFQFPLSQQLWLPLRLDPASQGSTLPFGLQAVARLGPGVSLQKAQAELDGIARALAERSGEIDPQVGFTVRPYVEAYSDPEMRRYLLRMFVVVLGVLLIACANVANLMLARAALASRETAVRRALGASRARLLGEFLNQALVLAVAGGGLGLWLAHVLCRAIQQILKPMLRSFWIDVRIDGSVAFFLLLLTLGVGLAASLLPALRASGAGFNELLKEQGRSAVASRTHRLGDVLVVAQIAISAALLLTTGLVTRSLLNIHRADDRFEADHVLIAQLSLPPESYPDEEARWRLSAELKRRLGSLASVRAATLASSLPGEGGIEEGLEIEGWRAAPEAPPKAQVVFVTPGYFEVFGLETIVGRSFREADESAEGQPAVVNAGFARRHFGSADPLGRRLRLAGEDPGPWLTIIGVVPDSLESPLPERRRGVLPLIQDGQAEASSPEGLYLLLARNPVRWPLVALNTVFPPLSNAQELRSILAELDPDLPALRLQSLAQRLAEATWDYRLFGKVIVLFGLVAFCLAAVGLYAVMSLDVGARRAEMGVRMALGARSSDNLRLVLGRGLTRLAVGVGLGLGFALATARFLNALLFRVDPWDATVFAAVVVLLAAAGLLASLQPALRAARLDPLVILR